ncbi:hypothetical protein FGO68_gene17316 [Halteria grandinella]|uniref:Uncharacterized protein n=1 Tax=Halteria grandinella TaxID=5974 RepID=A0A8J8T1W9_HALGN|nr:hypothetical protein FGO68_gene17316 [Halteria grandinella]
MKTSEYDPLVFGCQEILILNFIDLLSIYSLHCFSASSLIGLQSSRYLLQICISENYHYLLTAPAQQSMPRTLNRTKIQCMFLKIFLSLKHRAFPTLEFVQQEDD